MFQATSDYLEEPEGPGIFKWVLGNFSWCHWHLLQTNDHLLTNVVVGLGAWTKEALVCLPLPHLGWSWSHSRRCSRAPASLPNPSPHCHLSQVTFFKNYPWKVWKLNNWTHLAARPREDQSRLYDHIHFNHFIRIFSNNVFLPTFHYCFLMISFNPLLMREQL